MPFGSRDRWLFGWLSKHFTNCVCFLPIAFLCAEPVGMDVSNGFWISITQCCFQDVDDISLPGRIATQLAAARERPGALIGSRVRREPEGSTARYMTWANGMSQDQLTLQRFKECTLLMPTWFLSRARFAQLLRRWQGRFVRRLHARDVLESRLAR